ncbi:flagellar FliL protein [Limimonas halophila]|uniref:Flagellar protein FliL n=1 Tax=Limimonas halophila TaxID=1082479 RepID=A0A1G7Q5Z3_9PROT|nr:flagellar basal body-associated FliL family protein [Limimonas halophila]SDF93875.1 flagellar FliL protein [Limimonas halophila]
MSDEPLDDTGEDVELEATPRQSGMSGKKIVLFFVVPLLLVLGLIAGIFLTGLPSALMGGGSESQSAEKQASSSSQSVFYNMPTMLVNLNSDGQQQSFLKLKVTLELASEKGKSRVKKVTPRVVDNIQVYLRQLRMEDLQGSAGMQRLREELLRRVRAAADGAEVRNVLFKQMLVQ